MASNACFVLAVAMAAMVLTAHAGDPDILSDFVVPQGVTLNSDFFTFKGLNQALWGAPPMGLQFKVTKASQLEFPALAGQSVSIAALQFAPGAINPPHTHPRSSELLVVVKGQLEVGFVDTTNKLYNQTLWAGDSFVFPKGLVHFQKNPLKNYPAVAMSAFGSASAGTVALPATVFGSGIKTDVLSKSFKVDPMTIEKIVASTTQGN